MRYLSDVVTLEYDSSKCAGCGACAEVCPHGVFAFSDRLAKVVDRDACIECGACAKNCPTGAIAVTAGVGCAAGIIKGWLTGGPPTCDCSGGGNCC